MGLLVSLSCLFMNNTGAAITAAKDSHDSTRFSALQEDLDSLMHRYRIPGAAVAILSSDSVLYIQRIGFADMEKGQPVDVHTHFRTGSITKTFVALGILKLAEERKIELNTPVKNILPGLEINNPWEETHPLRVVHLLEHTSGLNDTHFNDYYLDGDPGIPLTEGVKVSRHYLDLRWPPGKYRSYSSAGYMVAGIIIEQVTGRTFEEYLHDVILDPLGMSTSTFRLNAESKRLLATGYKSGDRPAPYWHTFSRPAGSLNSSAAEMARFVQVMLNRGRVEGTPIISAPSIERMERALTDPAVQAGLEGSAGLGLGSSYFMGYKWYGHYGSIMGFAGAFGYCPELDLGCVLLTNYWDVDFRAGITRLWEAVREYAVGPLERKVTTPSIFPVSQETLNNYTGYYKWCNPPQQLSAWIDLILNYQIVKPRQDSLYVKSVYFGTWEPLIPVTESLFRSQKDHRATKVFVTNSTGKTAFIDNGGYYERTGAWKPWGHGILFFLSWIIMLSSVIYALFWIPSLVYKRIRNKPNRAPYLPMRIAPLSAVLIILVSFTFVGMQVEDSIALLGQKTMINVVFYLSSWSFALLSLLSVYFTIRSFEKPVKAVARAYAVVLSLACLGTTIYWGYWGLIGLKLWSY
jgi:CubicO group peptidase (beta-lactamase class C family)